LTPFVADLQLDATLLSAETAVRLDQTFGLDAGGEARARHRRQVRAKALDDTNRIDRNIRHRYRRPNSTWVT
jgi:hypothetical protein